MSSKLENSGIRVAVGDCSVTERRRWRPPYQTGKTVHMHTKTLQTQRGPMHGAGCVRQWLRTAEPLGERRYENWNTHILSFSSKYVYEQYLQSLNKRNSLFNKSKIKLSVIFQIYVTMTTKHKTIDNFTLKTLFPKPFIYFKQNSILISHTNDNDNQYMINQCLKQKVILSSKFTLPWNPTCYTIR